MTFLRVADLCAQRARYDDGLTWTKAGLDAPGKRPDPGLLDFCIKEYVRRRKFAHADEHAWQRFELHPTAAGLPEFIKSAAPSNCNFRALRNETSVVRNSATGGTPLRMAASNLAQRVADGGGLEQGLSY